ncbi:MAG TPA: hypothetical protein VHH73_01525, partial [Verrucomicrobiae bacterium]|nr:hypothetical protein [Verrucomicrobiae bacterium]
LLATAILVAGGCKKKADPVNEMEKAVAVLSKPVPAAEAPAAPSGAEPPAKMMQAALADYKAGKFDDTVVQFQLMRNMNNLGAEQRWIMQDTINNVMLDLYAKAEKGDAQAAAAIARYGQMQH